MLKIKPQNLHFPLSKLHFCWGPGRQESCQHWMLHHFLKLLLGAAKNLVLVVFRMPGANPGILCSLKGFNARGMLHYLPLGKTSLSGASGESRGGGSAWDCRHNPHQENCVDVPHGNAVTSPMENVPLGWLPPLLCKGCPELAPVRDAQLSPLHLQFPVNILRFHLWV